MDSRVERAANSAADDIDAAAASVSRGAGRLSRKTRKLGRSAGKTETVVRRRYDEAAGSIREFTSNQPIISLAAAWTAGLLVGVVLGRR
ncbi:MAG TPA: hypothetical protein VKS60_07460 [Stellaceae bacterium]|nr:hypothetical protein [Stellaceae bacterium]